MQFSNKKCDVEPYFCCPSFLCTRFISYCTRVVSCCTCVVSFVLVLCRAVLVLCCVVLSRVVSCCLVLYSCCVVLLLVQFSRLDRKCYCFSHSRVSRTKFFSCRPTMVTDNTFYFPKVHRSTLRIYCIFEMFMTSICEKKKLQLKYGLFIHFSAVHYLHKKLHLRCSTPF